MLILDQVSPFTLMPIFFINLAIIFIVRSLLSKEVKQIHFPLKQVHSPVKQVHSPPHL